VRGWIENIDRSRSQIHGYYTGHQQDAATAAARRACKQFVEGLPFEALAKKIRSDSLHVLIFPEIGMDPLTTKLATLRLAPVQCNSWGHPITSGMPSMDYYLSSDLMEPGDGQEHYTEKLVRLPNISVHYTPVVHPARPLRRDEAGLRASAVVLLCAQSLFKYLPQYDELFPRIAAQLADCQFAFFASQRAAPLTEKFQRRIARAFAQAGLDPTRHIVMLPRMDGASFQAVARLSDIYLDSIGWSGCNTTLETMACGLPPVTWPGAALRGRHTYAFLRMIGLDELIASDFDSYVALAVRLARDAGWRDAVRSRVLERFPQLAGDTACVRALEAFLEGAAANG
jgi:predicted O-linked N-acetylglucosamine transferase (SPINDLY family)